MTLNLKKSRFFPIRDMIVITGFLWGLIAPFLTEPFLEYRFTFTQQPWTLLSIVGINLLAFLYIWVDWRWEKYTVEPDSLVHSHGVFFRNIEFYSLDNIDSIIVKQNLIGILFNYGNVRLYSPFSEEPHRIKKIPHPLKTAEQIEHMLPDEIPIHQIGSQLLNRESPKKEVS